MKTRLIVCVAGFACAAGAVLFIRSDVRASSSPAPSEQAPGVRGAAPAEFLPPHGYTITKTLPGSTIPADLTFLLTRDEIYVPIAVRKPAGKGPFPAILMGAGTVKTPRAQDLSDNISGGRRVLKSSASLDSDDYISIIQYLQSLPYVDKNAVGTYGVSHSGELMEKAAAEITWGAAVPNEGAAHEFLNVDTGPRAPRKGTEMWLNDVEEARKLADKAFAMERIKRIQTPFLHVGRDGDAQQGIFKLVHQWMVEAGKDSTWVTFDHPVHGYGFIYAQKDGSYQPDPIQQKVFEVVMAFFDKHLKHAHATGRDDSHRRH